MEHVIYKPQSCPLIGQWLGRAVQSDSANNGRKILCFKERQLGHGLRWLYFAYNTSCHESALYTPFEIMFGRKATLPIDLKMEQVEAVVNHGLFFQDNVLDIEEITKQRCSVVKQVKENIEKAQIKQKQNYDRRHANPKAYQIGTKVLKKDFTRKKRKGGKMDCSMWDHLS